MTTSSDPEHDAGDDPFGWCFTASRDGRVIRRATGGDGRGRRLRCDQPFAVYCQTKAILATTLLAELHELDLPLTTQASAVLPELTHTAFAPMLIDDLLSHRAGLHEHVDFTLAFATCAERYRRTIGSAIPTGWDFAVDQGYSVLSSWNIVARLVEALSGGHWTQAVSARVLEPLGLASTFVGAAEDPSAAAQRAALAHDVSRDPPMPLLEEIVPEAIANGTPSYGGLSSVDDLHSLYAELLACASDRSDLFGFGSTLRTATSRARLTSGHDRMIEDGARFGGGFMVDPYEAISGFGHFGFLGSSFSCVDTATNSVVSMAFVGVVLDPVLARGRFVGQLRLIDELLDDAAP